MINSNNIVTNSHKTRVHLAVRRLLAVVEPACLLGLLYLFWFPIEIRYRWLPLLVVVPIIMGVRWLVYGRLFTRFRLDGLFLAFLVLGIANLYLSPYTAAQPMSRLYLLARPALGMALCLYAVEYARLYRRLDLLLVATLLLAGLVGVIALFASDWTTKSNQLRFIIDVLLPIDAVRLAVGKFNVNETAGALTWIVPLCAGLAAWRGSRWFDRLVRRGFGVAFVIGGGALFLGQSRFALAGVFVALALLIPLVIDNRRGRIFAWTLLLVMMIVEIMIVRNVFSSAVEDNLASRDDSSMSIRFDIWSSALGIIGDYPLTGAGLNMFREKIVRADYPVPTFEQPVLPHAHNEYLQIATDLGVPGLGLLLAWYGAAGYTLFQVYRRGDRNLRVLAAATGGGLLAHALFGLGDAIALWDRFAFVFWWLLALVSSLTTISGHKTIFN